MVSRAPTSTRLVWIGLLFAAVGAGGCDRIFPYEDQPVVADARGDGPVDGRADRAGDQRPADGPGPRPDGPGVTPDRSPLLPDGPGVAEAGKPSCGNGKVEAGEQCDLNPALLSRLPDAPCRPDCTWPRCGDSVLDSAEECDDGNRKNGDGCANNCKVEVWSKLNIYPNQLHFGARAIGCGALSRKVLIYAAGTSVSAANVKVVLRGCPAGEISGPGLPSMESQSPLVLSYSVTFNPKSKGDKVCQLELQNGSGRLYLPITGRAVAKGAVTDTYLQRAAREVDAVALADASSSMMDEYSRLKGSVGALVLALSGGKSDWHLGVLLLASGSSNEGMLAGSPPYVERSTSGLTNALKSTLPGSFGSWGDEKPYATLRRALTPPLEGTAGATCNSCNSPNRCVSGRCRGPNYGFRRPNGDLELLVFSDEDDQSGVAVSEMVSELKTLVNPLLGSTVRVSGLLNAPPCSTTSAKYTRHKQMSEATGGNVWSLCPAGGSYNPAVSAFGNGVSGLKTHFPLSRPLSGAQPKVKVNGKAKTSGWTYDSSANMVVFNPPPGDGAVVSISYNSGC